MEKYFYSGIAIRTKPSTEKEMVETIHNVIGVLEAASVLEAEGKAYRIIRKALPMAKGWQNHSATVRRYSDVSLSDENNTLVFD